MKRDCWELIVAGCQRLIIVIVDRYQNDRYIFVCITNNANKNKSKQVTILH